MSMGYSTGSQLWSTDGTVAGTQLLRSGYGGFNVTIPHKQAVMGFLDEVDPQALLCGAVNTVKNEGGRLIGYNTDGYGFAQAFVDAGVDIVGKTVVLLGAGGAARRAGGAGR